MICSETSRNSYHSIKINHLIGSILNPLEWKFSDHTRKKGKDAKTGASHYWRSFYLSQYDWLKGSHMTKVLWLPNEIDYAYCEFVAPNTPYSGEANDSQIETTTPVKWDEQSDGVWYNEPTCSMTAVASSPHLHVAYVFAILYLSRVVLVLVITDSLFMYSICPYIRIE